MKPSAARIARVKRLKATLRLPLTEAEKVEKARAVAAVRAEDERRRAPAQQMELGRIA